MWIQFIKPPFQPKSARTETTPKTCSHIDNAEDKSTASVFDPWNPPYPPYDTSVEKSYEDYKEWMRRRDTLLKSSRSTNIIIPDRTSEMMNREFYDIYPQLLPILRKDSVRSFLSLYANRRSFMAAGFIIIPKVLNYMVRKNALRCAEVALEGEAPELEGLRANPNYMNQYGYFPLHEAAESFSVDMIKLLLHHGASTHVRTAGDEVIEDLLPLHVAVENTCLHKYLQDGLHPNGENSNYPTKKDANYIYKLIHILCLPEMKIFLDTTRLLAEQTNINLVDEIWNYIKHGKLVQTAVLLLTAQAHIRVRSSCNRNGNSLVDGFSIIITRISEHIRTLKSETGQDEKELLGLQAKCELLSTVLSLVNIIAQAGKALDSYIQTHQEMSQATVLAHVSSILDDYGFFPSEECIRIGKLCPYEWSPEANREVPKKRGNKVATEADAETPYVYPADKKLSRNKLHRRREREYTWNNFFPYWRSVLAWRFPVKMYPAHSAGDVHRSNFDHIYNSGSKSVGNLSAKIPQVTSTFQSRRLFGTVALTLFNKVLKKA